MPPDPPSRYARYYHPATILFPPQLKILYETLPASLTKACATALQTQQCTQNT